MWEVYLAEVKDCADNAEWSKSEAERLAGVASSEANKAEIARSATDTDAYNTSQDRQATSINKDITLTYRNETEKF